MTRRIALCIPNFAWQEADASAKWHLVPYAVCLIAATVRDLCHVDIIDANAENLSPAEFSQRLARGYDVVGISVLMDQFAQSGHTAALCARDTLPEAEVVMGGVYPTIHPDRVLEDPAVSWVCIGEGEEVFRALLRHLWEEAPLPQRGLGYREKSKVIIQERAEFIKDLDALPLPAYDLVDFVSYTLSAPRKAVEGPAAFPYAHIITSRGCPQNCCFCQVERIAGRRFRPRSPQKILDEIALYKEKYGVRSLIFVDDNIVAQRSRAVELFEGMIARGLNMPWKAPAMAVFRLDEELIQLMAQSGCTYFCIAIESGSPRVRDEIVKKPVDFEQARRMVRFAQSVGINVAANFVVGFPTETWDEIRETIAFAEALQVDYVKLFTAIPLRHTALWDMCVKHGAFRDGFDATKVSWNAGQIRSPHFDDHELTLLRAYEWDRINFATAAKRQRIADMMGIGLDELEQIRKSTRKLALSRMGQEGKEK